MVNKNGRDYGQANMFAKKDSIPTPPAGVAGRVFRHTQAQLNLVTPGAVARSTGFGSWAGAERKVVALVVALLPSPLPNALMSDCRIRTLLKPIGMPNSVTSCSGTVIVFHQVCHPKLWHR